MTPGRAASYPLPAPTHATIAGQTSRGWPDVRTFKRLCVYCGSSDDVPLHYLEAAEAVGRNLARRGIGVVYGGGRVGMMGRVADGALAEGGEVIGVIPHKLLALELGHDGLTELFVVDSMHARKMMMATLSDGFIALPGGIGTFEELFEVLSWTQLNYHQKPVGVLDHAGYFQHLLAMMAHAADVGFVRPLHRGLLVSAPELDALIPLLAEVDLPDLSRWIVRP